MTDRTARMSQDLIEALETTTDPGVLWRRMNDAQAVIGFLGGNATDVRAYALPDATPANGHSFTITGVGGGRYHARIDHCVEGSMVSYTVWREDVPNSSLQLTYAIDTSRPQTMLTGALSMKMPLEELLASFSIPGMLALPMVNRLVRHYAARRLRRQLQMLAVQHSTSDEHAPRHQ